MMRRLFVSLLFCFATATAFGADTAQPVADDPALEKRLNALSAELRCLVCQNQSLADSHAELAVDLKNQVREQMRAGKSDDEIKRYLTDRYGDFVLYNPPVKSTTWLLWAGPFVLLVAGVLILGRMLKSRQRALAAQAPAVDETDRARARALLSGDGGPAE